MIIESMGGSGLVDGASAGGIADAFPIWSDVTAYVGATGVTGGTDKTVAYRSGGILASDVFFRFDDSNHSLALGLSTAAQRRLHIDTNTDYAVRISNTPTRFTDLGRRDSDGFLVFFGGTTAEDGYVFSGIAGDKVTISPAGGVRFHAFSAGGIVSAANSTGQLGLAANSADILATAGTNTGDQTITLTGDVTGSGTGTLAATLSATPITPGTYGDASHVSQVTFDAAGRATGASAVAIAVDAAAITSGTFPGARLPAFTGGDVTSSAGSVVLAIGAHAVTNAKFRQGAGLSVVGVTGSSLADVADIVGTTNGQALMIHSGAVGWAALVDTDLPATVTGAHFAVTQAASSLPNSVNLGALSSGVLQQTVSGSVSTPAAFSVGAGLVPLGAASGGGLATDSVFKWDATNHRLGVGTATPSYTLEVLGMTRHSGPTGINSNPDAEAFAYFQTQITGDRDRQHHHIGGAGTALASTGAAVSYVDWDASTTFIATSATIAAIATHRVRAQVFASTAATITDDSPATLQIDGPPTFSGGMTLPAHPRALRIKAGDVALDSGDLIMSSGNLRLVGVGVGIGDISTNGNVSVGLSLSVSGSASILGDLTMGSGSRVDASAGSILFGVVSLGGGAAATLGTIGGSGPTGAAQTGWVVAQTGTGQRIVWPYWNG